MSVHWLLIYPNIKGRKNMKRLIGGLVFVALVGIALSFVGSTSVSAMRANTDKGKGCFVRVSEEIFDNVEDPECTYHEVMKLDDDGNVEFYFYQDHGQTPWRPQKTFRETYFMCTVFEDGLELCGYNTEIITPNGEYKSTFKTESFF